ncbi:MAG TPA: hypothetical protein VIJ56_10790, partial [Acidimicrobiales bacterium]
MPLAILTLAIVVAVLGFAVHFLWIGALVLMGVLWGVMVAERVSNVRDGQGACRGNGHDRRRRGEGGHGRHIWV